MWLIRLRGDELDAERHSFRRCAGLLRNRRGPDGKLLGSVEDSHAQVTGIVLRKLHALHSLAAFSAEAKDRRAFLHDAPELRVVARIHLHPFHEFIFAHANLHGVVESGRFAQIQDELGEIPGRKTVLDDSRGVGNELYKAFASAPRVRRLGSGIVDHSNIREKSLSVQIDVLRQYEIHKARFVCRG